MSAGTLAAKVFKARNAKNLTPTALAKACGMSPKTIVAIEEPETLDKPRSFRSTTLAPLDRFFGWDEGEAYATWRAGEGAAVVAPAAESSVIAEQMAALNERVARIEEQPPWAWELIDACRLLTAEDRVRVLDLVHRLGRG